MNAHQLNYFRSLADAMQAEPTNWEWIGEHMSQRMFRITEDRAKDYAARFGGQARKMDDRPIDVAKFLADRKK